MRTITIQEHKIEEQLNIVLEDWSMMQKTNGDEGAEWAERFEKNFYELMSNVKLWRKSLPEELTLEELEEQPIIKKIIDVLPAPLQLNLQNELELIADNEQQVRYD